MWLILGTSENDRVEQTAAERMKGNFIEGKWTGTVSKQEEISPFSLASLPVSF